MHRTSLLRSVCFAIGSAALLGSAPSAVSGQDPEATRRQYLLEVPPAPPGVALADLFRGAPGTTIGTPQAFGPGLGDVFLGGGYQSEIRGQKLRNRTLTANGIDDGSMSMGFGLGNGNDGLGLTAVITSLGLFRPGSGKRMAFSFQLFRNINSNTSVAVGVENAFVAGGGDDEADSWYGVGSKVFRNPFAGAGWVKALTLSLGVGNGRFRMIDNIVDGDATVNVFGSAAVHVHNQVSLIGDYTGQDLNLGLSVVPLKRFPLALTFGAADVTQTAARNARFIIGAGLGMHF